MIELLTKFRNNKEDFKSAYRKKFPIQEIDINNIEISGTEYLSNEINREILMNLLWNFREYYIKIGLREYKLKRILNKNYENKSRTKRNRIR